ncbi:hypothetical protein [Lacipirellula limnantheis]|uniref:hypothetical protein n=1 Tax=Lacipirellula limnantheis TaxID=2528024 RepID=UPI0011AA863B|nr:hypothetical protein [Lacipirellula limnantheis]
MTNATRYFWQKAVTCNARQMLHLAEASLERGSTIEAGCRLREAVRVWLEAECQYGQCAPKSCGKRSTRPSPRTLAFALRNAGHCSREKVDDIIDILRIGNDAAHLVAVRPELVLAAISLLHAYLDRSPYLIESTKGGRS